MGRHSVPDDDADVAETVATKPAPPDHSAGMLVLPRGRHARSEDGWIEADGSEAVLAAGDGPAAREGAAAGDGTLAGDGAPRRPIEPGTRGDLQLLRQSASLRARCAAAVIVPFALYTIVLVAIKRTDVFLIWFWIPTVLAGVLIGTFLDAAHRRLRSRAE